MPRLNIDPTTSEFRQLRQDRLLYVDKTAQVAAFLRNERYQLYARPRRFGKSLLLSTIEMLYRGKRDLFAGDETRPELAVCREARWHWRTHRVLRLDMAEIGQATDDVAGALNAQLATAARDLGLADTFPLSPEQPSRSLIDLVKALSRHAEETGLPRTVVILVDEYDAPILNRMHRPQEQRVRPLLTDFYGAFKSLGPYVEKVVMTGVTRFVKTGLWSQMNQVRDQSANPVFHDLTGFTDRELDALWEQVKASVPAVAPREGWAHVTRNAWREWYDGYRFAVDADSPIYNPFAIMSSLKDGRIGEYWSETGHLGVVEALLQAPPEAEAQPTPVSTYLTRPDVLDRYELSLEWLDDLQPAVSPEAVLHQWQPAQIVPLLYQTGYLTLTPEGRLVPPNREIASYLGQVLLRPWLKADEIKMAMARQGQLVEALVDLDIPGMVTHFNALLQMLPHQRFRGTTRAYVANTVLDVAVMLSKNRVHYHEMEKSGLGGDADTVFQWDDVSMVVEFKPGTSTSAREGQRQIADPMYWQTLPRSARLRLGLALYAREGRQIDSWICQGYSALGQPLGMALTDREPWPAERHELYGHWGIDQDEAETAEARYAPH